MRSIQKTCMVCGGKLSLLLELDNMPASAQNIPTPGEAEQDHPITLRLCQCGKCGLVQLDNEPVSYYKDVIRAGGQTKTMRELRHNEYEMLLEKMEERGFQTRRIVEIGCGRGEFLHMWDDLRTGKVGRDFTVYGIEHKKALVECAVQNGLNVTEGFAEGDFKIPNGPFDAFVQFNFLEHQPDPVDMLRNIRGNLKMHGLGLVTVPSFEYILENDGYYELIRDHIANYTMAALKGLFVSCGFAVLWESTVNRDTLEILVEKTETEVLPAQPVFDGTKVDVSRLKENYKRLRETIEKHLAALEAKGEKMALWGAGHQGFTLASATGLAGKVKYIIDSADFKQGKLSPASHIPIVPPEHYFEDPVEEILIVAPGYAEEIAQTIREKFGDRVIISVLRTETVEVLNNESVCAEGKR